MPGQEGWLIDAFITALRDLSPVASLVVVTLALGMCGLGLPVPEDLILITTGFLAAMGKFPLGVGIAMGLVAILCGDSLMFFTGRHFGERVFEMGFVKRMVKTETLDAARERVRANARFICFIARFLPGLRAPIYLTAGAMRVRPAVFVVQDGLAAAISVPVWVVLGWWFGGEIENALLAARSIQGWLFAGLAVVIAGYVGWHVWLHRRNTAQEAP